MSIAAWFIRTTREVFPLGGKRWKYDKPSPVAVSGRIVRKTG